MRHVMLGLAVVLFAASSRILEEHCRSAGLTRTFQRPTITLRQLGDGKMKSIMEEIGIFRLPKMTQQRYWGRIKTKSTSRFYVTRYGFTNKLLPHALGEETIRTSVDGESDRLPVLSVCARHEDLYGREYGIIAARNRRERGRAWERWAHVALFRGGQQVFETLAGLRLHGGASRILSLGMGTPSFRLHFRDHYGLQATPPGAFYSGTSPAMRRLILHNDRRFGHDYFLNPLAYDIAGRIGCIVPRFEPVELYLNGERLGNPYFVTEYLSRPFVRRRLGHDEFKFVECRVATQSQRSVRPLFYAEARRWAERAAAPLTCEQVAQRFDLDNLMSWIITVSFCATTDPHQGLIVFDERAGQFWLFVHDLDQSFQIRYPYVHTGEKRRRHYEALRNGEHYKERTFEIVKDPEQLHSILYHRLLAEDPEFRRKLAQRALTALNHLVTPHFVEERLAHYRNIARRFGMKDVSCLDRYERFLRRRPAFYRSEIERLLGVGPIRRCRVEVPEEMAVLIDNYRHTGPYSGYYLPGTQISLRLVSPDSEKGHTWIVNGKRSDPSLGKVSLEVAEDLSIALTKVLHPES